MFFGVGTFGLLARCFYIVHFFILVVKMGEIVIVLSLSFFEVSDLAAVTDAIVSAVALVVIDMCLQLAQSTLFALQCTFFPLCRPIS